MLGEARLLLVEVHRHDAEVDGRPFAQGQQHRQQRERILAAGHADHHHVAFDDHAVIHNGLARFAHQLLLETQKGVRETGLRFGDVGRQERGR